MGVVRKFCSVVIGLTLATSAIATQTVTPVRDAAGTIPFSGGPTAWTGSVGAGGQFVFYGRYSTTSANPESGLGLKVVYDDAKFTNVVVDQLRTKCMVATPQKTINAAASTVVFGWADTSIRLSGTTPTGAVGWTGVADPAPPGQAWIPNTTTAGGCLNPGSIVTESGAFGPPTTLFRITATAAAGFTVGQSSPISLQASSFSSATPAGSGFTNQTLTVTVAAIGFNQAVSRKTHGGAGDFDIPLTGATLATGVIEPRAIGAGHKIVFQFTGAVTCTGASATTTSGTASLSCVGAEAIVTLIGVPNATRVQVDVVNISGLSASAFVGFLLGDTNGNKAVQGTDVTFVQQRLSAPVTAANFKADVNANGAIQGTDVTIVQQRLSTTLP